MADADIAAERLSLQPRFQRLQFTFGAPTSKDAVVECGDARKVVAAVFEALERIDQLSGNRLGP